MSTDTATPAHRLQDISDRDLGKPSHRTSPAAPAEWGVPLRTIAVSATACFGSSAPAPPGATAPGLRALEHYRTPLRTLAEER